MPSTADVLDQHLRCFGENDLDGVVADYSSDAAWADIEDVLSDEWEIGAPAMTIDAIHALVAGE